MESVTDRIFQGIKTSADKIYVLEVEHWGRSTLRAVSPMLGEMIEIERAICRPLYKGTEMRRFGPLPATRALIFPYAKSATGKIEVMRATTLKTDFPLAFDYLKRNEKYLRSRESGAMDHAEWIAYGRSQAIDVINAVKIVTPDLAPRSSFFFDERGEVFFLGGAAGGYGVIAKPGVSPLYLLALLNSRAIEFFITRSGQQMESGYFSFEARFIRSAPIPSAPSRTVSRLASLAERMTRAVAEWRNARGSAEKTRLRRVLDELEEQIDSVVYDLFGLTSDEIALIEESTSRDAQSSGDSRAAGTLLSFRDG